MSNFGNYTAQGLTWGLECASSIFLECSGGCGSDAPEWWIVMQRRTFVAGLATTACLPRAALAQASAVAEIVLFYAGPTASAQARANLIRDTLSAEGFVEGKSFVLSMSVASDNGQLPGLARDLVRPGVRAILAVGPVALRAARTVTATIPIVALDLETDPVKAGLQRVSPIPAAM
jgi:putative ABC transport system substrate-binding protein